MTQKEFDLLKIGDIVYKGGECDYGTYVVSFKDKDTFGVIRLISDLDRKCWSVNTNKNIKVKKIKL